MVDVLPFEKDRRTNRFKMQRFQEVDLQQLADPNAQYSANWSEMGCFKTSTAEFLIAARTSQILNPRVLIITTKSGKGTYYETLFEILPDFDVFTCTTKETKLLVNGEPIPYPSGIPDETYKHPVAVIAHYHCFTNNACVPRYKKHTTNRNDPDFNEELAGKPIFTLDENGENPAPVWIIPFCTQLLTTYWDVVVIDEAHRIKNPDAQWSSNILKKLTKVSGFRHPMTGTGFINNPAEVRPLFLFMDPNDPEWRSKDRFEKKYCKKENINGFWKVTGTKNKEEFRSLIRRVGVRRLMTETHPNIKEPIFTRVTTDLNPTQRRMNDEILRYLYTESANGVPLHSPNILSMRNRLRQIAVATPEVIEDYYDYDKEMRIIKVRLVEPSSKLDALMELIEGLEWDDDKRDQLVVFSCFKDPLVLLEARLTKAKIPYIRLLATDTEKVRFEKWHNIWPKKEHQLFLTSVQLGSESINLSSAQRAVFLDRSWSPKDNLQAIGRIYRPGQLQATQIINIEANGTTDQYVEKKLDDKIGWFNEIFGPYFDAEAEE